MTACVSAFRTTAARIGSPGASGVINVSPSVRTTAFFFNNRLFFTSTVDSFSSQPARLSGLEVDAPFFHRDIVFLFLPVASPAAALATTLLAIGQVVRHPLLRPDPLHLSGRVRPPDGPLVVRVHRPLLILMDNRKSALECNWLTRDSFTLSVAPISFMFRSFM